MDTKTTTHIKSKHEKLKTRIAILLIAQESGGKMLLQKRISLPYLYCWLQYNKNSNKLCALEKIQ